MYTYLMICIILFPWSILIAACIGWFVQRRRSVAQVKVESPVRFRKTA
jgi:hypothetical protein